MVSKSTLRRNLVTWIGSLLFLFGLIIIAGIFLQGGGVNIDNVVIPFFFLIIPSILFIMAFYGLRHKFTFSKEIIAIVLTMIIFCIGFNFGSMDIIVLFGALGGIAYFVIKSIPIKSREDEYKFGRRVGTISLILGILSLLAVFWLLIRNYIVFG